MTDREKIENIKKKLKELTTKDDGNRGFEFTRGGGKRRKKGKRSVKAKKRSMKKKQRKTKRRGRK